MSSTFLSLGEFERQHGINKGTVSRKARELGFDTANGLSSDAYEAVKQALNVMSERPEPSAVVSQTKVELGNHQHALTLRVGQAATSLEQFRTDRTRLALTNPREFMTGLTGFLDQVEQGMDQAEAQQEQELLQVRQLKRQSQKRIEQFRRRADEYRIKTDVLAHIQNAELDDLQDLAAEVNALGKPDGPGSIGQPG